MRIGIFAGTDSRGGIDRVVEVARQGEADGFSSMWIPQVFGLDAATVIAVVGREVPRIELGTAVIPIWQRHPHVLAAQALTTQDAIDGRFALGIGLLHKPVVEGMLGMSFDKPVGYMREYLSILLPLVRGEGNVSVAGERLTFRGPVEVEADPVPVLLAALGPQMLALAGRETDGTITWVTGPSTLDSHVVPTLTKAAADAGRPSPRVVSALPVAVTADIEGARERAARVFEIYGMLPSYRAMLDREGAATPADVSIIGDEDTVATRVRALADVGVTDFIAVEFARGDDLARTREVLKSLL